jgi:glycine cleavage system pyridoxal-binding protein P
MATVISSDFEIAITLADGQGTTNLTQAGAGRTFQVVALEGTGDNTGTQIVSKVSAAGAATTVGSVTLDNAVFGLINSPGVMQADATFAATDGIRLVRGVANSTECKLICIAGDALPMTET